MDGIKSLFGDKEEEYFELLDHQISDQNKGKEKGLISESTERKEITILLLGETGVGKSTFINALINYLLYDDLDEATKDPICHIPAKFSYFDSKSNKMVKVTLGKPDPNESLKNTESSTQCCRCYDFNIKEGKFSIKIIDTPGIGDTRGLEADKHNLQQLFDFLSNYKELNAICILLKPNNARIGIVFRYCILQLLSHLNKTASNNIIFCFTNCRGTLYEPGDSAEALTEILEQVKSTPPHIDIKFNQDTIYCFDNESFRYLAAVSEPNNIVFKEHIKKEFESSWKVSVKECQRMFGYINGLKPHLIQDTISINDVRRNIILLAKPMTDISNHILKEIEVCNQQKQNINEFKGNIKELKEELYIPSWDIISKPLDKPMTVCADKNCCEEKAIQGVTKTHYKQICHKPCYLDNPDVSIIGNKGLLDCKAFNISKKIEGTHGWYKPDDFGPDCNLEVNENGLIEGHKVKRTKTEVCKVCNHSFQTHLHIYYKTKYSFKKVIDENKQKEIKTKEDKIEAKQRVIDGIETKINEIKEEHNYINECSAYFAIFLKNNALLPFNDAIEGYLTQLIHNKRTGIPSNDGNSLESLEVMLSLYLSEKEVIENAMRKESSKTVEELSVTEIAKRIPKLYKLKHYGSVIEEHIRIQKSTHTKSHSVAKEEKVEIKSSSVRRLLSVFKGFFK